MAKSTSTATAEAAGELVHQPVFIINTAPIDREAGPDAEHAHRGNTPWLILIPALLISFVAQTPNEEPICGFFEDDEAMALASRVYDKCRSDPELLEQYRQETVWPEDFGTGYKIMQRFITVQPFVPALA
jgi:hypothetical protein